MHSVSVSKESFDRICSLPPWAYAHHFHLTALVRPSASGMNCQRSGRWMGSFGAMRPAANESGDYAADCTAISMGGGLCLNGAWGYSALASQDTSRKVLARAAALVGIDALARRLQISARVLRHYLTGFELIPEHLF